MSKLTCDLLLVMVILIVFIEREKLISISRITDLVEMLFDKVLNFLDITKSTL